MKKQKSSKPATATPPNPLSVKLAHIQNLKDEREMLIGKHREHRSLAAKLESDEKELLAETDISEADQFKKLSELRLRRELLPSKIESLKRQEDEVMSDMAEACNDLGRSIAETIEKRLNEIATEIFKRLQPFWDRRPQDLNVQVQELVWKTNFGLCVREDLFRCRSGIVAQRPPLFAAFELAELVGKLEYAVFDPFMEPMPTANAKPTVEDLEREELRRITADPEMFIVSKMRVLPRPAAEKAVEARRMLLFEKYTTPPKPRRRALGVEEVNDVWQTKYRE